ncbi:methylamine utilization protein MauJ [Nitratireductor sp.]|uniref:methylamine utilization protein MauJ n=1 Tax=Nitratireductor sp. TaxID=1872084 RepID=UPI0025D147A2|nr:methylamine utilization protein MauJ [Nitratireductor sp.]
MYAKSLSSILHKSISEAEDYSETLKRFEGLRSYHLLPRGRGKAGERLTNEQIASAIIGFVPKSSNRAGQVASIMGDLRPVGGIEASFQRSTSLNSAIAALLSESEVWKTLISLSLSMAHTSGANEYQARLVSEENGQRRTFSYVSKYAISLTAKGSEEEFDHDRPISASTRQLILGRAFFRELKRNVALSRSLNLPVETDWCEYQNEEELGAFCQRLGATSHSCFLNIGVDTDATWPKSPTRISFGGHHFVLFPKTSEYSHSISIDLHTERITNEEALTLLNRFLSLLSWCDDCHAVLRDGWSGNPVPVPVPRHDTAFATMQRWMFYRTMPQDNALLNCLSYYREGLNAAEAGIASQEVLSFFKVFEMKRKGREVRQWIADAFEEACANVNERTIEQFHKDRNGISVEKYIFENCRVASAHASRNHPSDGDNSLETIRLSNAAQIIRALARHHIRTIFNFSESYLHD